VTIRALTKVSDWLQVHVTSVTGDTTVTPNEQISARESQTLVNFVPAPARRLPDNTLRPKLRDAWASASPLALKEPTQQ
jgi:hypothetical protein